MRIFDPHIHMSARTTDDYESMFAAGVRAVVEPAFWLGQPRTNVGSFIDYFDLITGWERFRASQFGIRHHATIGLNPKEANDPRCREVMSELPRFLVRESVVAIGETGYDSMTVEEQDVFEEHMQLSKDYDLPVLVHTPHRDKLSGTKRTLDVVASSGVAPELVVVDHLNELTVDLVAESGCWMGFSIYPDTKMDEQRMVAILRRIGTDRILINSAADWGRSDVLKTLKTGKLMLESGFTEADVDRVLWQNPIDFYGQSGRVDVTPLAGFEALEAPPLFEGNSVQRGAPVVAP
ncbi:putative metal-dependent TIM-barrel fold hydrolase [Microbacteriaceae bacterium SG_E_30_P1]|uniref:Metal-dependent TIM-barrel fold hydrolase n=1 Tax=Antiquaquibacter oligotrophicus TaxID=2880260 RepID=A0ABT6KKT9_9MICO|nr:TatD family hydrolase [Antiquaquibacter oligotrophicus]MDH6180633.1 putative metal-dependent TIM-barrel fold hydrolase [Antiquaquibacter oligotrophicus]UDF13638.1 TatD family hydrolase [Antiquaquibacter oligotrophicus]